MRASPTDRYFVVVFFWDRFMVSCIDRCRVEHNVVVELACVVAQVFVAATDFIRPFAYRAHLSSPSHGPFEKSFVSFIGKPYRVVEIVDDLFPEHFGDKPLEYWRAEGCCFAMDENEIEASNDEESADPECKSFEDRSDLCADVVFRIKNSPAFGREKVMNGVPVAGFGKGCKILFEPEPLRRRLARRIGYEKQYFHAIFDKGKNAKY